MVLTRRQLKALKDAGIEPSPEDLLEESFDKSVIKDHTPKRKQQAQSADSSQEKSHEEVASPASPDILVDLTEITNQDSSTPIKEETLQASNLQEGASSFIDLTLDELPNFETPKRRGRPPKANARRQSISIGASSNTAPHPSADIETPKRRGRPPKAQGTPVTLNEEIIITADNSLAEIQTSKKRGRPSKALSSPLGSTSKIAASVNTSLADLHTPTSASKNIESLPSADISLADFETPKRRGRPPKAHGTPVTINEEITITAENALMEIQTSKKRGRPSKAVNTPQNATTQIAASADASLADLKTPKRRGRPSKNAQNNDLNDSSQILDMSMSELQIPKKRGRHSKAIQVSSDLPEMGDSTVPASSTNPSLLSKAHTATSEKSEMVDPLPLENSANSAPTLSKISKKPNSTSNSTSEETSQDKASSEAEKVLSDQGPAATHGAIDDAKLTADHPMKFSSRQEVTNVIMQDATQVSQTGSPSQEKSASPKDHSLLSKAKLSMPSETFTQSVELTVCEPILSNTNSSHLQVSEALVVKINEDISSGQNGNACFEPADASEPAVAHQESFMSDPHEASTPTVAVKTTEILYQEIPSSTKILSASHEIPELAAHPQVLCDTADGLLSKLKPSTSEETTTTLEQVQQHTQEDIHLSAEATVETYDETTISQVMHVPGPTKSEQLENSTPNYFEKGNILPTCNSVVDSNEMIAQLESNDTPISLPQGTSLPLIKESAPSSEKDCFTVVSQELAINAQDSLKDSKSLEIYALVDQVNSGNIMTTISETKDTFNQLEAVDSPLKQLPQKSITQPESLIKEPDASCLAPIKDGLAVLSPSDTAMAIVAEPDTTELIALPSIEEAIQESIRYAEAQGSNLLNGHPNAPAMIQPGPVTHEVSNNASSLNDSVVESQAVSNTNNCPQSPSKDKPKASKKVQGLPPFHTNSSEPTLTTKANKKKSKKRKNKLSAKSSVDQSSVFKKAKHSPYDSEDASDLFQKLPGLVGPSFIATTSQVVPKTSPPKVVQPKCPEPEESSESEGELDASYLKSLLSQAKASAPKSAPLPSVTKAFSNGKFVDPVGDLVQENLYIRDASNSSHPSRKTISSELDCPLVKVKGLPSEKAKISNTLPTGLSIGATLALEKQKGVKELKASFELAHKPTKAERVKLNESNAGAKWFNLPAPVMTPELKRDLELLSLRNVLDKKRFYKKSDKQPTSKFLQVGTIIEDKSEFYSARMSKRERQTTMVGEVLNDAAAQDYFKSRFDQIQQVGAASAKKPSQKQFKKKHSRQ